MLWKSIQRVALAATGALAVHPLSGAHAPGIFPRNETSNVEDGSTGQVTFVAGDKAVAFGLTIPKQAAEDYYFTIRVPIGVSWGAIGLGSDDMAGSLVLMIYMNAAGDNVTFSPRTAHGHYEPEHNPEFKYEVMSPTGLFGDHMIFSGHCLQGCRNWRGGNMDVSDANQKGIYAVGPVRGFQSDNPAAGVKFHEQFGTFGMNLSHAVGAGDPPVLNNNSTNLFTSAHAVQDGKVNSKSIFHGVIMLMVFLGLLPMGVFMIRVGKWVRWHAVNQTIALFGLLAGFIVGVLNSKYYQRSRKFNSAHQIIGFILVAFIFVQFGLGFFHHRIYKRTQKPTKLAPAHVWLGRVVMVGGIGNAYLGFPLALNPQYNWILAGLTIALLGLGIFLIAGGGIVRRLLGKSRGSEAPPPGYDTEPWRHADAYGGQPRGTRGQSPPPQHIGLMDVTPERGSRKEMRGDRRNDLGAEQAPREFA